jgi:hypothetical protein
MVTASPNLFQKRNAFNFEGDPLRSPKIKGKSIPEVPLQKPIMVKQDRRFLIGQYSQLFQIEDP